MKNLFKFSTVALLLSSLITLNSCRTDDEIIGSTSGDVTEGQSGKAKGFFLLNEGNMGSNKSSLDYFDYATGVYSKNIFPERNPYVASELGDVGNDIKIWKSRLFAVINCSNLVEIMDVETAKHITAVAIPNCRYITFNGNYAYVSSYAGKVEMNPNARKGYVAKIDLNTYEIVATCTVGYQPEEMVVIDDKLYVANSGGYMKPNYDSTVSVIDLNSFTVFTEIEVAINLHRMVLDDYGKIWVSSRGDDGLIPSKTYTINTSTHEVTEYSALQNSNMALYGDNLYISSFNYSTQTIGYKVVDTKSGEVINSDFVDQQYINKITVPYGLAVNGEYNELYITDAGNYVTPGKIYCFDMDGNYKWDAVTGDIPAHIVFTDVALKPVGEDNGEYTLQREDIVVNGGDDKLLAAIKQTSKVSVYSKSDEGVSYEWFLDGESISKSKTLDYTFNTLGDYTLKLTATQGSTKFDYTIALTVNCNAHATSVLEYMPAPGQHINTLPMYEHGDNQEDMNAKALEYIKEGNIVSLGGYGGYITVGFDHTIENKDGFCDFRVYGNNFSGSSEAGIIMVAYDSNKNNRPDDDEWYEIAGSSHIDPTQESWYSMSMSAGNDLNIYRDYTITYQISDSNVITWSDNKDATGTVSMTSATNREFGSFPQWVTSDKMTFSGTRLPQNGYLQGANYVLNSFAYGYADNALNNKDESAIDIAWAVDKSGNRVNLTGIDFIRVYTGVNQRNGILGECSTDVTGFEDLHITGKEIKSKH